MSFLKRVRQKLDNGKYKLAEYRGNLRVWDEREQELVELYEVAGKVVVDEGTLYFLPLKSRLSEDNIYRIPDKDKLSYL